jgi:hypothetical protein
MNRPSNKQIDDAWARVQGKRPSRPEQKPAAPASLMDQMAQDAGISAPAATAPDTGRMKLLADAVQKLSKVQAQIAQAEQAMAALKETEKTLATKTIPDMFDELGMKKFSLTNGTEVSVDTGFASNISSDHQLEAFAWLSANGHDGLIKHDLTVKLKRNEQELYDDIKKDLQILGADFNDKEYIHPQSLKAFVNEQMNNGSDIPQDVFGVYPIRVAKLKTE